MTEEKLEEQEERGGTVFYPDLDVKCAAAAGPFRFPMTENGEQQDICNLITVPYGQIIVSQ